MDDAWWTTTGITAHRNYVPVSPYGDRRVDRGGIGTETTKQAVQPPEQTLPRRLDLTSGCRQPGTGTVEQVPVGIQRLL
jgi:hypothetical protein